MYACMYVCSYVCFACLCAPAHLLQVSVWDMKDLGFQTSQRILRAHLPLRTLQDVCQNFPLYGNTLARITVNQTVKAEISHNQQVLYHHTTATTHLRRLLPFFFFLFFLFLIRVSLLPLSASPCLVLLVCCSLLIPRLFFFVFFCSLFDATVCFTEHSGSILVVTSSPSMVSLSIPPRYVVLLVCCSFVCTTPAHPWLHLSLNLTLSLSLSHSHSLSLLFLFLLAVSLSSLSPSLSLPPLFLSPVGRLRTSRPSAFRGDGDGYAEVHRSLPTRH